MKSETQISNSNPEKNSRGEKKKNPSYTASKKSFALSSVCFKTTQTKGGVCVAGACPPTSKLETFL